MKRKFPLRARSRPRPIKIRKRAMAAPTPHKAFYTEHFPIPPPMIKMPDAQSIAYPELAPSYSKPKCIAHPNYRGIYKPRLGCTTCWPVYWHEHLIPTEYAGVDYLTNLCKLYGKARVACDDAILTPSVDQDAWRMRLDKARTRLIDLELLLHEAAFQYTLLSETRS